MKQTQVNLIHKFLKLNYNNLKIEKKSNRYFVLQRNAKPLLIYELKHNHTLINLESVIRPIVKMFETDFEKTREIVIEWFLNEYNIDKTK